MCSQSLYLRLLTLRWGAMQISEGCGQVQRADDIRVCNGRQYVFASLMCARCKSLTIEPVATSGVYLRSDIKFMLLHDQKTDEAGVRQFFNDVYENYLKVHSLNVILRESHFSFIPPRLNLTSICATDLPKSFLRQEHAHHKQTIRRADQASGQEAVELITTIPHQSFPPLRRHA